jgi:hypothetical protein
MNKGALGLSIIAALFIVLALHGLGGEGEGRSAELQKIPALDFREALHRSSEVRG